MLVFGIDIPLVEVILVFSILVFIILFEALVIIILMTKQLNKMKQASSLVQKLSETVLAIRKVETQELMRIKKK
jgi:hypothetical protein